MTKVIKKIALASLVALGIVKVSTAMAGGYIYEYLYYSDSSYSQVVGNKVISCNGYTFTWGQLTSYRRLVSKEPCDFSAN